MKLFKRRRTVFGKSERKKWGHEHVTDVFAHESINMQYVRRKNIFVNC